MHGSVLLRAAPRCRLNLDDAVMVLRNLSFPSSHDQKSLSKTDIENIVGQRVNNIVGQRVQAALLSYAQENNINLSASLNRVPGASTSSRPQKGKKNSNKSRGEKRPAPKDNDDVCTTVGKKDIVVEVTIARVLLT